MTASANVAATDPSRSRLRRRHDCRRADHIRLSMTHSPQQTRGGRYAPNSARVIIRAAGISESSWMSEVDVEIKCLRARGCCLARREHVCCHGDDATPGMRRHPDRPGGGAIALGAGPALNVTFRLRQRVKLQALLARTAAGHVRFRRRADAVIMSTRPNLACVVLFLPCECCPALASPARLRGSSPRDNRTTAAAPRPRDTAARGRRAGPLL